MTFWLRFGLIAIAAISCFLAGSKVSRMACQAEKAETLRNAEIARQLDENFIKGADYRTQEVLAALKSFKAAKQTEVIREISRVEYQCEFPPAGERMRLDRIDATNKAVLGIAASAVPDNTDHSSQEPGRTPLGISGPGDDVR